MAHRAHILLIGIAGLLFASASAFADNEPVIVVPGRPGVPVIIQGVDATGAVVYGDWGLYRPGAAVVIEGGIWPPAWTPLAEPPHYFPATGRTPDYGRKEIDPGPHRRGLAPEYHKSWQIESKPGPVTQYPPFAPPAVVVAPPVPRERQRGEHR